MITNEQLVNMFIAGFRQTVKNCSIILEPMLAGIIVFVLVGVVTLIIKNIFLEFLKQHFILIGNSKKTAKKKVSKVKDIIDLGISANDINNTFK